MPQISTNQFCIACSEMGDHSFHTNGTFKKAPQSKEGQKLMKVCQEDFSTQTDIVPEIKLIINPQDIAADPQERQKVIFLEMTSYDSEEESSTLPEKMSKFGKKASGAPRKKGDFLKNFYPKLKRYIERHSPIDPYFSICNRNRIKMLNLYGDLLQPLLIELLTYNRLKKQPNTDKQRWKENQRIWEKEKASQLLDEYDKLCKKS